MEGRGQERLWLCWRQMSVAAAAGSWSLAMGREQRGWNPQQGHPPASMPAWKLVPLVSMTSAAICRAGRGVGQMQMLGGGAGVSTSAHGCFSGGALRQPPPPPPQAPDPTAAPPNPHPLPTSTFLFSPSTSAQRTGPSGLGTQAPSENSTSASESSGDSRSTMPDSTSLATSIFFLSASARVTATGWQDQGTVHTV
jgi:hypothetical protein